MIRTQTEEVAIMQKHLDAMYNELISHRGNTDYSYGEGMWTAVNTITVETDASSAEYPELVGKFTLSDFGYEFETGV